MSDVVGPLIQELASLEAQLNADPRYRKIARIRALLSEYELDAKSKTSFEQTAPGNAPSRRVRGQSTNSKAIRVRDALRSFLILKGAVHRNDLLKELTSKGIMGNEKDPLASLAAYLSQFKDFTSVGNGQWALAHSDDIEKASVNGSTEALQN